MKIGYDARLINQTGVGRYIQNTLPYLIKNKKNKWCILIRKEDRDFLVSVLGNTTNVEIIDFNYRWHSIIEQIKLPQVLYPLKLDIFFTPYINVPVFYFKRKAVTIHDLTVLTHKTGRASTKNILIYSLKRIGYRLALRSALRSKIIFTVAQSTKKDILENFPRINKDKIIVTYNGFTKIPVTTKKNVKSFVEKTEPYLFYVGNAHPHKNLDFMVESLDKMFTTYKRINVVIAGKDDFFMTRLQSKIRTLKNYEKFYFYPSPTNEELGLLYKNAKVVILPSLKEGFGLQILEAMSFDLPIICSRIPVYREVSNNYCIYFDPTSTKSFLLAVAKGLKINKRERDTLAKKYHAHLKKFNWEDCAHTTLKAIENKEFSGKILRSRNY